MSMKRAVGFSIYVKPSDKRSFIERFRELDLELIDDMEYSRENLQFSYSFTDGSRLSIWESDIEEESALRMTFSPGDEEDNFSTSESILKEVQEVIEGENLALEVFTVGVETGNNIEPYVEKYTAISAEKFQSIRFSEGELEFKISKYNEDLAKILVQKLEFDKIDFNELKSEINREIEKVIENVSK